MNYKVLYNDFGCNYVVQMEDGSYVMANLKYEKVMKGGLDLLMKFGMWDDETPELDEQTAAKIREIIEKDEEF